MPHLDDVPIVLVTSMDEDEVMSEAIAAGAQGVVTKPLQRARLREWIQKCLARISASEHAHDQD
jgi:CheY-like chemotaxis protein